MFTNILVGYDGARSSVVALRRAAMLARQYGARLTALWVCEHPPRYSDVPGETEEERAAADAHERRCAEEVNAVAREFGISIEFLRRTGHPAKQLVKVAEERAHDLIVVGHSTHSELWGRLLGDTADRVCDHAPCSVLVVR